MEVLDKVIIETVQSSNVLADHGVEVLGSRLKVYLDAFICEHKVNSDVTQGVLGDLHDNEDCKIDFDEVSLNT